VLGPDDLPLGSWSHIAGTYDGVNLQLYVNGHEVASKPASGKIINSTGALRMGGNSIWGEYFVGTIDEVRVYNRGISQIEIQNDMSSPLSSDTGLDSDGDGMSNMQEVLGGTDPYDPGSSMRIISVESIGNDVRLFFSSIAGKRYRVEGTGDITTNVWTTVVDNIPGTGSTVQVIDLNGASQDRYFFRVRLLP